MSPSLGKSFGGLASSGVKAPATLWLPVPRAGAAKLLPQRRREQRTASVKDPGVADVGDVGVGRKTKPLERAEKEFDVKQMVDSSRHWRQVETLLAESPHLFQNNSGLLCTCLLKTSELVGGSLRSIKDPAERAEAKALVDGIAALLVQQMHRLQGQAVCGVVLSLRRLGYAPKKLMKSVFLVLSDKERPDEGKPADGRKRRFMFTVSERSALLATFAEMGLRPPPETVNQALANSYQFIKFCTPQDMANLAKALTAFRAVVRPKFAGRMLMASRENLADLDPTALVNLAYILANAGYEVFDVVASPFVSALMPVLGALPSTSQYATLLFALLRIGIALPPDVFDTACSALMEAPPVTKAAAKVKATKAGAAAAASAAAGKGKKTRVELLSAPELVVVLGVLSVQFKYTPEEGFVAQLLASLQDRCSELTAEQAAVALQLFPGVFKEGDGDARDDAADLIDELLALMESGISDFRAADLQGVAEALQALQHTPDAFWMAALRSEVARRAAEDSNTGRPSLVALAGALAALPAAPTAPAASKSQQSATVQNGEKTSGPSTSEVLQAIVQRGGTLGGFSYVQVDELRRHIDTLVGTGLAEAVQQVPEAAAGDFALDADGQPDGSGGPSAAVGAGIGLASPRITRARTLEVVTPEQAPAPEPAAARPDSGPNDGSGGELGPELSINYLLGYAGPDPDLPLLLATVRAAQEAERMPAPARQQGTAPRGRSQGRGRYDDYSRDDGVFDGFGGSSGGLDNYSAGGGFGGYPDGFDRGADGWTDRSSRGGDGWKDRSGWGGVPRRQQQQQQQDMDWMADDWSDAGQRVDRASFAGRGGGGGYDSWAGDSRRGADAGWNEEPSGSYAPQGGGWSTYEDRGQQQRGSQGGGYQAGGNSDGYDDWDAYPPQANTYGASQQQGGHGAGVRDDDGDQWDMIASAIGSRARGVGAAAQQPPPQQQQGQWVEEGVDPGLDEGFDGGQGQEQPPPPPPRGRRSATPAEGGDAPIIRSTRAGRGRGRRAQ